MSVNDDSIEQLLAEIRDAIKGNTEQLAALTRAAEAGALATTLAALIQYDTADASELRLRVWGDLRTRLGLGGKGET